MPVPPGDWVLLSVLDTGTGMDADTAAQAFEPFFTTKDATRGSGLGLSMVYGIVKQSGGFTWIETAPGAGTSVHVLLPAVQDDVASPARDEHPAPARTNERLRPRLHKGSHRNAEPHRAATGAEQRQRHLRLCIELRLFRAGKWCRDDGRLP